MGKGVKPRTHLMIDVIQFFLLAMAVFFTLMAHIIPGRLAHLRFMFHFAHGAVGIALCVVICVHLIFHLPWIKVQLKHYFQ